MQRAKVYPAIKLLVALAGLGNQPIAILQCHDGIYRRVETSDVIEIGVRHFDARSSSRADRVGKRNRVKHHDIADCFRYGSVRKRYQAKRCCCGSFG
jgi:hypothetical protein